MVDYNQVRVDAAVNALNGLLTSSFKIFVLEFLFRKEIAKVAVKYADDLVDELQRTDIERRLAKNSRINNGKE